MYLTTITHIPCPGNSDTSLTDPWARMISYHFLNQTTRSNFFTNDTAHGAGQLWSHIPSIPSYAQHQTPFPLIMADSRPVGSNLTTLLAPEPVVYEITPLEFGSWDPNLSAMMNLSYVGTHLKNGVPDNDTACVRAFDQAGFIMGTSASLFNVCSFPVTPREVGLLTLRAYSKFWTLRITRLIRLAKTDKDCCIRCRGFFVRLARERTMSPTGLACVQRSF